MKNKMVKVFIDEELWKKQVMMYLQELSLKKENKDKLVFTTQKFKFDGATLAVIAGAAILALGAGLGLGIFAF